MGACFLSLLRSSLLINPAPPPPILGINVPKKNTKKKKVQQLVREQSFGPVPVPLLLPITGNQQRHFLASFQPSQSPLAAYRVLLLSS